MNKDFKFEIGKTYRRLKNAPNHSPLTGGNLPIGFEGVLERQEDEGYSTSYLHFKGGKIAATYTRIDNDWEEVITKPAPSIEECKRILEAAGFNVTAPVPQTGIVYISRGNNSGSLYVTKNKETDSLFTQLASVRWTEGEFVEEETNDRA